MKKIYVTLQSELGCPTTGHSMATNPWAIKPLLTASTMINCLAWSAHQADSWWLVRRTQWHHQNVHWRSGPWKPCKVSAQKNFIVKADTLSNLFSHSNWIKQQQIWKLTNLSVQALNSTVHRLQEVISMASTVCSAVTPHGQTTPDTFWARQCWKK